MCIMPIEVNAEPGGLRSVTCLTSAEVSGALPAASASQARRKRSAISSLIRRLSRPLPTRANLADFASRFQECPVCLTPARRLFGVGRALVGAQHAVRLGVDLEQADVVGPQGRDVAQHR